MAKGATRRRDIGTIARIKAITASANAIHSKIPKRGTSPIAPKTRPIIERIKLAIPILPPKILSVIGNGFQKSKGECRSALPCELATNHNGAHGVETPAPFHFFILLRRPVFVFVSLILILTSRPLGLLLSFGGNMLKRVFIFCWIIFISGCGTVSTVRPLPVGQNALSLSVGGPIAELPGIADVPLPYSTLRYRWGVYKNLEAHIGLHPTMLVFGTIGLDAGLSYELIHGSKLTPSLVAGINPTFWINPFNRAAGFSPEAEAVASWTIGKNLLVYSGGQAFFQLEKPYVPWAALIGWECRFGAAGLGIEAKWYAPTENSEYRVVRFPLSPGKMGAFGAVVGFSLYPGGRDG